MQELSVRVGSVRLSAVLNDSKTAFAIIEKLPLSGSISTWGGEIYFTVPVSRPLEYTATEEVRFGDIGYWPSGNVICIFFGKTPASTGPEPRPTSAVNIIGRVKEGSTQLFDVVAGTEIVLDRV